jgi:hypothetical protein
MKTTLSTSSRKGLALVTTVVGVLLAVSLLLAPVATAATAGTAAKVATYPVKLTASPKSHTYHVGDSPSITITAKNTGASTFKATSCVVEIEYPNSTTYHKLLCPNFKSFSLGHGATAKKTYSLYPYKITSTTPKGTYHVKLYFTGTVGSTSYKSQTVAFTATIA